MEKRTARNGCATHTGQAEACATSDEMIASARSWVKHGCSPGFAKTIDSKEDKVL
jgi:hypothetical protein